MGDAPLHDLGGAPDAQELAAGNSSAPDLLNCDGTLVKPVEPQLLQRRDDAGTEEDLGLAETIVVGGDAERLEEERAPDAGVWSARQRLATRKNLVAVT